MSKDDQDKENIFKHLESVARGIVGTFGPRCEVVVHDLDKPDSSLIIIEDSVTGRKKGAVETVAKVLGVSTITLYKYLREVGA